uniref:BHLH domain-containing protein n=1 Tax=Denticeps clupeoides TaxID=299321 RepID=A0AAY4BS05_9TELE
MEYFMVPAQKVPSLQHFRKTEKEVIGGLCSLANIPLTPETARDQERRIRREIANSNERRRMQSINAGFQSLKTLIPHSDGEKLSKVRPPRGESGRPPAGDDRAAATAG